MTIAELFEIHSEKINQREAAEFIGISESAFSRKKSGRGWAKGGRRFSYEEVTHLQRYLRMKRVEVSTIELHEMTGLLSKTPSNGDGAEGAKA